MISETRSNDSPPARGRISLVGLGPGSERQMTPEARQAILEAEVIVGYKTYLKLVAELIGGKEVVGSGMREELPRCALACRRAAEGARVALISSGDAGVYGMAGPAFELLLQSGLLTRVEVVVIPGITALLAAAARVGAPLTHDFCAISLSDLLTPWEVIEKRLRGAAMADFVTALYNPRSVRRQRQLDRAREIFLEHRAPTTPVAIVTAAYRPGESVLLTDLASLDRHPVGMQTTVIIGNTSTFSREGVMVTPRGYGNKYSLDAADLTEEKP
ncbi:MAG: precorrin-3B C(17)-methyltransferase [Magnetococcales bacterium]|nr:precorrin-3B C(17)-methyltransferase [Magnetococcales bacterium]MBF0157051.1 precorrin-3B C(17)-methyltransferase [Magnetococcales bacterium]